MQKLYCFVDETGQDTEGNFFLVVVVISEASFKEDVEEKLEDIEWRSRKGKRKWKNTKQRRKIAYMHGLFSVRELVGNLFYASYRNTREYLAQIIVTIAQAVFSKVEVERDYRLTVYVDGLNFAERKRLSTGLGRLHIVRRKVQGLDDESSSFIRLADALCGFLRDHEEGAGYTEEIYQRLLNEGYIKKL
jgi:hypothetical protein